MKENKNSEVIKYILENYNVQSTNDIADVLKDIFNNTIQTMMNVELGTAMGYSNCLN